MGKIKINSKIGNKRKCQGFYDINHVGSEGTPLVCEIIKYNIGMNRTQQQLVLK